jgi:hypothetical protein
MGSHETKSFIFRGPTNADENLQALEDVLIVLTSDIGLPLNTIFYFRGPTNADENLQALEDQLLEAGPETGGHHSHADHHPDEAHASPEAQTRVSPPTFPV